MIFCKELNKDFKDKHSMLKGMYESKDRIISTKKAHIHTHKRVPLRFYHEQTKSAYCLKGMNEIKGLESDFIYPVISNTNYADSHKDVHMDNSMNRTVKNQQGKVHYAMNHNLEIGSIIAYPKDVEMLIRDVKWTQLGKDYKGSTQALLFKTNLQDYSPDAAIKAIKNNLPVENSIRMQYVQIEFGIKEKSDDWADANKVWEENSSKVVNIKDFEEEGFLWFVTELKIVDEGSMVVKGSNDATPIKYKDELAKNTSSKEALEKSRLTEQKREYLLNKN